MDLSDNFIERRTILIQKIGQIGVTVRNLEQAVHFYKEKLDLPLLFQTDNMAFFVCNGLRLLITLPENEEFDHLSSTIYFQVEDIKSAYEKLRKKKVLMESEPHLVAKMGTTETWMAFFRDSEGNMHALMSEIEAA
ncbi:VOC family protein [Niallia sp. Sow4_A1]|jgi:methylmalonyl-CoA/ethylmalonyl-CoA epimerase|uniref:VOC family protein n=1 Tax=Niallia hominis TaxID=3133173 RepID=A0ABV1EXR8_9BACI|nr:MULTISPECIES: VOC family protein [Bacillaceae]MCM3363240.1 VOC family protein [Niallia sp. MER TA 168]REB73318.1 VOC family protein [Cutibacterium acnes]